MKLLSIIGVCLSGLTLIACSPVKIPVTNQYQLTAYSSKKLSGHPRDIALWVTPPEAVAGYQTEQMLYVEKPFQVSSFVKNSWTNPPGDMLYPLIVQSLQRTGYFHAVMSSTYSQGADYRIDTQLLTLKQNFLKNPSVLEFSAKVVLTRVEDNNVAASTIITLEIPCPSDAPYGGVIAANKATLQFTGLVSEFVVAHIKR